MFLTLNPPKTQNSLKPHDFSKRNSSYSTTCTSPHRGTPYMIPPHSPHPHGYSGRPPLSSCTHKVPVAVTPPPLLSRSHMASAQKGGGGFVPPPLKLYTTREEVYHYTYVGGGCVGVSYMGSPGVGSCRLCYSSSFFSKNRGFLGVFGVFRVKNTKIGLKWLKMGKNG